METASKAPQSFEGQIASVRSQIRAGAGYLVSQQHDPLERGWDVFIDPSFVDPRPEDFLNRLTTEVQHLQRQDNYRLVGLKRIDWDALTQDQKDVGPTWFKAELALTLLGQARLTRADIRNGAKNLQQRQLDPARNGVDVFVDPGLTRTEPDRFDSFVADLSSAVRNLPADPERADYRLRALERIPEAELSADQRERGTTWFRAAVSVRHIH
jgi:hypothetical protein